MPLDCHNLYTQRNLYCMSPIENAFCLKNGIAEFTWVHCGSLDVDVQAMRHLSKSFENVYPACERCKSEGKSETYVNQRKKVEKRTRPVDVDDISEPNFAVKRTQSSITERLNKKSEEPILTDNLHHSMEAPTISSDQPTTSKVKMNVQFVAKKILRA